MLVTAADTDTARRRGTVGGSSGGGRNVHESCLVTWGLSRDVGGLDASVPDVNGWGETWAEGRLASGLRGSDAPVKMELGGFIELASSGPSAVDEATGGPLLA
jgi:hypothetical protein